ncbi:aminoacyl-tRNA hydrolase [Candidatus Nitrosacidococcus tergens]|uniref:Peptidyl-tRNA hydrolase n=1 Tax=Candidatus Nitrosacidococcus tergens TaxID=553981 RepID=A0A7G1QBR7_9GAMM|nr:aminoacyl-tRNA hydrolase [Candidatus Nitrosacidococcus tergens]CAB1277584.1 peptidyl-tRNA hydrolase [Candidatus Nitrosacidococcus tergens]
MGLTPWALIGLGNPGEKYTYTRHNVGFWWLDFLAKNLATYFKIESKFFGEYAHTNWHGHNLLLLKPTTFMNHSGQAVSTLLNYYKVPLNQLLIIHDELDLPPGIARIKREGGHGGHNGLRDIINYLNQRAFLRLRLGIGHPKVKQNVVNYVLNPPSLLDQQAIEGAIGRSVEVIPTLLAGEIEKAMHQLHSAN